MTNVVSSNALIADNALEVGKNELEEMKRQNVAQTSFTSTWKAIDMSQIWGK